jgi:hypothetical protein
MMPAARRAATLWVGAFIAVGGALWVLHPDSYQQDGGYHFLFARWAWVHADLFVDVWNRPAFTLLYSLPAQAGYAPAKLLTVLVCAACAWQTWRLAIALNLPRSPLAVPLLFLQPSFFLICTETMTEPIFALQLIIALRLHVAGRVTSGMIVASTLILSRPEGAVVIAAWAGWMLLERRRWFLLFYLGTGAAAWWLAALVITGDPLFIAKSWPENWSAVDSLYGSGAILGYAARLPEIAGPLLGVPFLIGSWMAARRGPRVLAVIAWSVFMLHTVLWAAGAFGSAGYPRYMVTVSPAIALLSLIGWNAIADRSPGAAVWVRRSSTAVVLAFSAIFCGIYVDSWTASRDASAIEDAHSRFLENPRPVNRFIWSHAYMAIRFDDDPRRAPPWKDRETNLRLIGDLPTGTLVFWDADFGPNWFHMTDADFARAGFERVFSRTYELRRRVPGLGRFGLGEVRRQEMHLLYKPDR